MTTYRTARRKAQKRCKRRRWSRCAVCRNADGGNCETFIAFGCVATKRCRTCGHTTILGGGKADAYPDP